MGITYHTADLHLNHARLIDPTGTQPHRRTFSCIEEHDQTIEDNWNSLVTKHDKVFVHGDVTFQMGGFDILHRLKGFKVLIKGNHDDLFPLYKYADVFDDIQGALKYHGNLLLSHIPIHESQMSRFKANIHGHLHSDVLPDPRYLCVSLEQTAFTPISHEECLSRLAAQLEKSGQDFPTAFNRKSQ